MALLLRSGECSVAEIVPHSQPAARFACRRCPPVTRDGIGRGVWSPRLNSRTNRWPPASRGTWNRARDAPLRSAISVG